MIPRWQDAGYRVKLIYLSLPSVEMEIARVAARVAQGGHHVPEEIVRRRFSAGLHNFHQTYKQLIDIWILYDNSQETPILIERSGDNG